MVSPPVTCLHSSLVLSHLQCSHLASYLNLHTSLLPGPFLSPFTRGFQNPKLTMTLIPPSLASLGELGFHNRPFT